MKQPHFDDRYVLQRAEQVVPLNKIRVRRLLFLSGAFAIAMILGAASALLAVHIKQRQQITQIPQTSAPETSAAIPVESPESTPGVPLTEEATEEPTEEVAPPVRPVVTPKKQAPIAQRPRMVGARPNEVEPSEEEQLQQIREAVLYDQWQERRMRRVARRERRNRGDRDLSHVDEIFEGPRRRDRP